MGSRRSRETSGRRRNPTVSIIRAHAQAPAAPGSAELADSLPGRRAATRLSSLAAATLALASATLALAAALALAATAVAVAAAAAALTAAARAAALVTGARLPSLACRLHVPRLVRPAVCLVWVRLGLPGSVHF